MAKTLKEIMAETPDEQLQNLAGLGKEITIKVNHGDLFCFNKSKDTITIPLGEPHSSDGKKEFPVGIDFLKPECDLKGADIANIALKWPDGGSKKEMTRCVIYRIILAAMANDGVAIDWKTGEPFYEYWDKFEKERPEIKDYR